MDIFDFEELIAEMLNITDEQREDDDFLPSRFYDRFDIDFELAFDLAKALLPFTPQVVAGLTMQHYHAFVSEKSQMMLMKIKVD